MVQRHCDLRTYTLAEFAVEQRLLRREKALDRLREEKLEALRQKVSPAPPSHPGERPPSLVPFLMSILSPFTPIPFPEYSS